MGKALTALLIAGLLVSALLLGALAYRLWAERVWRRPSWPITEEPNTYMTRNPAVEDFVPLGITYQLGEDGLLTYTPDSRWKQSCFILVAIGWTADGRHTLMYQGRLPFTGEGAFKPRICVDGEYVRDVPRFGGGMYYCPNGTLGYPYPTVYVKGDNGYVETISYDERGRRWFHAIRPPRPSEDLLELEFVGQAIGVPFWMGPMEGPYIVHGAYSNVKDVDIWGGFWVSGTFEANLTLPGQGKMAFRGYFIFDRAVHRVCYSRSASRVGPVRRPAGSVLAFSCLAIFHEDFIIMISHSDNPTPTEFPKFQHQGRINLVSMGLSYVFNNFTLTDAGNPLQPESFHLHGPFENGYVDLEGEVISYWPPGGWHVNRGTWWDLRGRFTWGRAFIKWTGTLEVGGEVINITDAIGVGEFTRFSPGKTWLMGFCGAGQSTSHEPGEGLPAPHAFLNTHLTGPARAGLHGCLEHVLEGPDAGYDGRGSTELLRDLQIQVAAHDEAFLGHQEQEGRRVR